MEAKEEEAEEVEAVVVGVMEDVAVVVVRVRVTRKSRTAPSMVPISVISRKDSAQLAGNLLVAMVGHMQPEFVCAMQVAVDAAVEATVHKGVEDAKYHKLR